MFSGLPCNFKLISVMKPSVPSEPNIKCVRSYPAEDFLALVPVLIILPSGSTTSKPRTCSLIVPNFTVFVPDALVAHIPPIEALAPGSTGKKSPVSRKNEFKSFLVTPA